MNLSPLLKLFSKISAYNTLADALHGGELTAALRRPLGVLTAARPALLAALHADLQRPILFITARADRARILTEQIQIWIEQPAAVYRLPDPDSLPHERVAWGSETIQGRLAALTALVVYREGQQSIEAGPPTSPPHPRSPAPLLVTSARALMSYTLPPAEFTLMPFKVGQRINLNEVLSQWVGLGYQPEEVVEVPGSFSRRGGILDIFPPSAALPVRIELFGDEIDSLRHFDPVTQRSDARLESFVVGPAIESLPRYAERAAVQLSQWDLSNLQPSAKIAFEEDVARLAGGATFRGIEYYLPFFYNGLVRGEDEAKENLASSPPRLLASSPHTSVLDYLTNDALIFIEDAEELALVVDELETQARTLKRDLTDVGDLPGEWLDPYFGWGELSAALAARQPLVLGGVGLSSQWSTEWEPGTEDRRPETDNGAPSNLPTFQPSNPPTLQPSNPPTSPPLFASAFVPAPAFGGQIKNVVEEIVERKKKKERVVLVSRQAARLSHLLAEQANLTVTPAESLTPGDPPPPSGSITLLHGTLMEGWAIQAEAEETPVKPDGNLLTVMSDSELFGWKKPTALRQRKPRKGVTPETFFADVNPGDLVVHIEHGIGRYAGLVKLNFEGVEREYLEVRYANNDKLYVPIHQADRLARYVGMDEAVPSLNRLGNADWNTVKRRAKKAVEEIAKELLEIYAKREVTPGRAYSPDTEWQREIEDAFPFVETEDQLRAIAEVKADMEKPQPMDRLICGDVGYGKTEVALRAAFKAVLDGVQVAVLAPTTILAQQHYQTFQQRMASYPVKIEMLSRFRTPHQQEETLKNLAAGVTDIVIGTHRLLQKDVVFQNLGLLVIDEEQRFGVKHKEKLKAMRADVDVLTLTATPIPRTLHMSLSGVRDLSTIDTPPDERLPIQTTITEYDEGLIRTAILRELDRGGQIFFVYNRVMGIEQMANRIRNIVPEARVEVAHGQMSERHLERVMIEFLAGEFDVLVSTTIIENGLDMPNVNTILIDRADRLGLAQLYQLRGRVGRGAVRAYAYLLTPKHHELNPDARKRLEAIAEASELGAGFRIAMRDLEIRGAGELLGAKQHGQIAAVGFDLYTRLLAQAVRELRGESPLLVTGEEAATYLNPLAEGLQLNLPIPAYVPEDYLPEEKLRLRLYRRLAGVTNLKGIDEMAKELEDRFGELPEPVANLLYQLRLKILAMEAGVKAILTETGQIIIRADSLQEIDRPGLQRRLSPAAKVTPRQISLPLHPKTDVWQAELEKTLRLMGRMLHDPAG
ncbi:MAG: transcription-repair coupling factor [Anaerolineae bacterium]|nr:transcription-repair coupling factor [Anaerolineales bacterium]MCQ3974970.1 transcription-repair coupling factor [Anaerolineae bacterium]